MEYYCFIICRSAYNDMLLEKEKEVQTLQNELRLAKEAEQKRNEVLLRQTM